MSRKTIFLLVCFLGSIAGFIITSVGYDFTTIQYWISISCVTGAYLLGREYESRK